MSLNRLSCNPILQSRKYRTDKEIEIKTEKKPDVEPIDFKTDV
jgi:hypothetical protein